MKIIFGFAWALMLVACSPAPSDVLEVAKPAPAEAPGLVAAGIDANNGSIGGLRTGMTKDQLVATGNAIIERVVMQEGEDYVVMDVSLHDGLVVECWFDDGRIERLRTTAEGLKDEQGIGVGSTMAALKAAYPDGRLVTGNEDGYDYANFVNRSKVSSRWTWMRFRKHASMTKPKDVTRARTCVYMGLSCIPVQANSADIGISDKPSVGSRSHPHPQGGVCPDEKMNESSSYWVVMKSLFVKLLCPALLACLATAPCSAGDDLSGESVGSGASIVAGHGEPSFTENFGLEVDLPMGEISFCSLLESKRIGFRLIDTSNPNEILPLPRHRRSNDSVPYKKMYEIYGGAGLDGRSRKTFRAYVDANSMVVYIENAFSYTGPSVNAPSGSEQERWRLMNGLAMGSVVAVHRD